MNQTDREHLDRIETKIDAINERSIRTEDKVTAHLEQHEKRVKYGLACIGVIGTVIVATFKYLIEFIKGIFD